MGANVILVSKDYFFLKINSWSTTHHMQSVNLYWQETCTLSSVMLKESVKTKQNIFTTFETNQSDGVWRYYAPLPSSQHMNALFHSVATAKTAHCSTLAHSALQGAKSRSWRWHYLLTIRALWGTVGTISRHCALNPHLHHNQPAGRIGSKWLQGSHTQGRPGQGGAEVWC